MTKEISTEITYETVDDSFRTRRNSAWANSPLVRDLLAGNTLRVTGLNRNSGLYKIIRQNGLRLRTLTGENNTTIVWAEQYPAQTEVTEIEPETVEVSA